MIILQLFMRAGYFLFRFELHPLLTCVLLDIQLCNFNCNYYIKNPRLY